MASSIGGSSSQSTNEAANQSTVYGYGSITITVGNFSGLQSYGRVWIGGQNYDIAGPTSMSQGSSWSWSASRTYTHDANGYRGNVDVSVEFWVNGTSYHANSTGAGTQGAIDYDRRPGSPSISISRSVASVSASLGTVNSPASAATYYCQRSENSGAWGDQKTGQSLSYSGLPLGSTQQFRSFASNTDGSSGFTYSSVLNIPNVPSAPSSISATTPSALSTTISIGTATDNGASITGYFAQASADNGVTWGSPQAMTNQSYTFTSLVPGATYKFRTYAVNEMGAGAYAVTPSTFVPAGGKRWNGLAFIATAIARRWTGSQWVDLTIAKRWTGTQWTDLS